MLLQLERDDDRPLYDQITTAIRKAIIAGDLTPGDRLPSGRDLADSIGVTLETVQRAYRQLKHDGIVVSRVGRGTTVHPDLDVATLSLIPAVDTLLAQAKAGGFDINDVVAMIETRWG